MKTAAAETWRLFFCDVYSFHIMQDFKEAALEMLHKASGNLYNNRILLENVFLFWRYMSLFGRRLTLWKAPPASCDGRCQYYFERYSPFFLYRDIWATMLVPYWKYDAFTYHGHNPLC